MADSTGYAETIALHELQKINPPRIERIERIEASHCVIGYRRIIANLGFPQECTTPVFEDNSAAETFARQGMGLCLCTTK